MDALMWSPKDILSMTPIEEQLENAMNIAKLATIILPIGVWAV